MFRTGVLATTAPILAVTSVSFAQPAAEDLGRLRDQPVITREVDLTTSGVKWYRLEHGASYYDQLAFDFELVGPGGDTAMALYDRLGRVVSSDEDDGHGRHAAMSFNAILPYRLGAADLPHDGRDGVLTQSTWAYREFYLAVARGGAQFGDGYAVTPGAAPGVATLRITTAPTEPLAGDIGGFTQSGPWRSAIRYEEPLNSTLTGRIRESGVAIFAFRVDDPSAFWARLASPSMDLALYLFDGQGRGVAIARQVTGSPDFVIAELSSAAMTGPDTYYLAVTAASRQAVGCPLDPAVIWNSGPLESERLPDGPGAACELAGWSLQPDREGSFALTIGGGIYWPCYIPCIADYDQSGGVDGDDITAFFNDWLAGHPCADVDGSGGLDAADIERFFCYWGPICNWTSCA